MNRQTSKLVLEHYKAHYTPKETAAKLGYSYQTIVAMYRSYRLMGIDKYNRSDLIPQEVLDAALSA